MRTTSAAATRATLLFSRASDRTTRPPESPAQSRACQGTISAGAGGDSDVATRGRYSTHGVEGRTARNSRSTRRCSQPSRRG